jgi:hypothetical protein
VLDPASGVVDPALAPNVSTALKRVVARRLDVTR